MKGIVLAGGSGTRLYPITISVSKQLLPVYDKPMIYYPISVLMQAGIQDILIISTPEDTPKMQKALGNGKNFGINLSYKIQESPDGIAQSFIIAEEFIAESSVCLILGDNIFYGSTFEKQIKNAFALKNGGVIFGYRVSDPQRYGVVDLDEDGKVRSIVEKPKEFISNYAVTGLYFYDNTVVEKAKTLKPSARGELEITDIHNLYLDEQKLRLEILEHGTAWLDAGTFESLLDASHYVQVIEKRQGIKIACLEEIALANGWISRDFLHSSLPTKSKNSYFDYLLKL